MIDFYPKVPKRLKKGHCYRHAVEYIQNNYQQNKHLRLVHGWVTGTGVLEGIRFSHAWVEDIKTGNCIDPSNNPDKPYVIPRPLYYYIGRVNEQRLIKYTPRKMLECLVEFETFGPWNTKFDETLTSQQ